MKLRDVRKLGIKHCEENDSNYTFISYDDTHGFSLSDKENGYTVFIVNKNGSLDAYLATNYATDFHKELKRRKNSRRKNGKRKIADMYNRDYEAEVTEVGDNH